MIQSEADGPGAGRRDDDVIPCDLRTEDDSGLIACAFSQPRLAWRLESRRDAVLQVAYQIEVAADAAFTESVADSGVVSSESPFLAPWPAAPLASRERRWWRVRVQTDKGWTRWSEAAAVEATLLRPEDWIARPISPISNKGRIERGPAPLLRREFALAGECRRARLYVTALGVHDVQINAVPVGNDLLEPGWTAYRGRHLFATYDVTSLLRSGGNVISSALGEGWWRGELTWMKRRGCYGDTTALLAQLEIETLEGERIVIATDETWRGGYGGLGLAELYDGADFDERLEPSGWRSAGFDDSGWEPVVVLDRPATLEPRAMPGVQVLQVVPPHSVTRDGNRIQVDAGQNLAGYLRLQVHGGNGARVIVRHAEVLDDAGRLHTAALRNARATDSYILAGESQTILEPRFTFHGFRYAEIELSGDVAIDSIGIVVIGSALSYAGTFECSDAALNRLFANTVWSQRGNFLALPTDCPQRDERLGWSGDIQVFAETASLHADSRTFLASWLKDLALQQRRDGCVPSTVPNVIGGHEFEYGGVGWGDAATIVPWTLFVTYGDRDVLARQYSSMRAWVDYGASRRDADGVWRSDDLQLGDWLDPGAPPDRPFAATTNSAFIATAFLACSAGIVARTADVLGFADDAVTYRELSQAVRGAAWRRWHGTASTTQTGCAIAIMFDIAPEAQHRAIGAALAALVERNRGRIATGFLGTPLVLPALARTGQFEAAYRLLQNRECPGWLYQVERGATTMWERWDAVLPDGRLHKGEMQADEGATMTSFNHYAYGCVAAWLYRTVAGIAPDRPGFSHVVFAPRPGGGLTHASASVSTAFGKTSIAWALTNAEMRVAIELPAGATGDFRAPAGYVLATGGRSRALASGAHRILCVPERDED